MEFNEIIAAFAQRHAVEGLVPRDGQAALDIDGISVTLAETAEHLAVGAEIGEPPADGRAEFADLLLEANRESPSYFAKTRETGRYVLVRLLPLAGLEPEGFDAALEAFVATAETWRRLLEDYRPAAADASDDASDAPSFGEGGFLPV